MMPMRRRRRWHACGRRDRGAVAGLKIATTTRIMQELMGIDHPCGGMIFARRIHASGSAIPRKDFVNLVIECELAVRLGRDMPERRRAL